MEIYAQKNPKNTKYVNKHPVSMETEAGYNP